MGRRATCNVCGDKFNGKHGVAVHQRKAHAMNGASKHTPPKPDAVKSATERDAALTWLRARREDAARELERIEQALDSLEQVTSN